MEDRAKSSRLTSNRRPKNQIKLPVNFKFENKQVFSTPDQIEFYKTICSNWKLKKKTTTEPTSLKIAKPSI